MKRIYKLYDFAYKLSSCSPDSSVVPGRKISMSGYPENLFSTNDWYTLSSGLASTETDHQQPQRSYLGRGEARDSTHVAAHHSEQRADFGPSWAEYFSMHNTGTYNN
jgi:hypothetical protein